MLANFFTVTLPIAFLTVTIMIQTWWLVKLGERVELLQKVLALRDWIDAISSGESPSDLAYMREKGFIK